MGYKEPPSYTRSLVLSASEDRNPDFPVVFGGKPDRLIERVDQTGQRTEVIFLPGSPRRAPSLLPNREARELAGLLTARSYRQTWTGACQRACPRQCAGESAGTSQCYKREPRDRAKLPRRSGSPVMRPKTLPGSQLQTGKTRTSPSHHWKRRARTHAATAQDSSPPVPWRWGS